MMIKREHPQMYERLGEAPITLETGADAERELTNYLTTLKEMAERKSKAKTS